MSRSDTLRLGSFFFRIESKDAVYKQQLSELFVLQNEISPPAVIHSLNVDVPSSITPSWQKQVLPNGKVDIVRVITLRAFEHYGGLIWLNAAVLVTSDMRTILVSGGSASGKTTTSFALAAGLGWKIANEDITLIDTKTNTVVALASPMSIRSSTIERVRATTNATLPELGYEKWCSVREYAVSNDLPARFDACFHLERKQPDDLECTELPPSSYVRQLLRNSNLIKLNATDALEQYVSAGCCWLIRGGSLEQRLEIITETLDVQST